MILGYIRVSTEQQGREDRSSLQVQTDIIEGFARMRGASKYDVQIYEDAGVSGATKLAFRPAGEKLLADMQPGDTVIASKLDRMFRSANDALNMLELFKERGVHLVLFDMGIDPVTGDGTARLLFIILAAVADMERVRIRERTADGRKAKKAKGGPIGAVPFGYRKVGEGRSALLEVNEQEMKAADRMLELYEQGKLSYHNISRKMAAEGLVSRTGRRYDPTCIRRVLLERIPETMQ